MSSSRGAAVAAGGRKVGMRSLNELLIEALNNAAVAGEGDEEPEVLPAPEAPHGRDAPRAEGKDDDTEGEDWPDDDEDSKGGTAKEEEGKSSPVKSSRGLERVFSRDASAAEGATKGSWRQQRHASSDDADRMMEEEERRVAALTFDPDALLPFENMTERAKYIPLRLSYEERKSLRMVNAAIRVSDYTNSIDVVFKNKAKRSHSQLQYIVAFLSGIVAATDYEKGQEVLKDRNFEPYESMIQDMLEIARRYKITNPEKMRSEYGKLVFLMQDSVSPEMQDLLGVSINKPIKTVYALLESKGGLAMLQDVALGTATQEILPGKKDRYTIQSEIKRKEKAAAEVVRRHTKGLLKEDDVRLCLYSISDNNSFLNSNRKPILDCITVLQQYFSSGARDGSLAIDVGRDGSRLSHSHDMQFNYVLQSLHLWAAIIEDMFRLWYLAEQDLLAPAQPYELRHTGQGLQRVQQSPRVYRAMHEILQHTQQRLGKWVGSSVIHLGDNNVPNTLVFIDKYTQVSRILGPLVTVLKGLETACETDQGLKRYMEAYGGIDKAKRDILRDFFTHAFDGSGGDNFFDAGSCIDGRLTSAWNWCSQLEHKPFYPLFRLTGFLSFDGEFDK